MRTRSLSPVAVVVLTCMALIMSASTICAQSYWIHPLPGRWCPGEVTYSFDGGNWTVMNPHAFAFKAQIYIAINMLNLATLDGAGIPLRLVETSAGQGQISLNYGATSIPTAAGETDFQPHAIFLENAIITYSAAHIISGNFNNGIIALHELLHALGLHHAYGPGAQASIMYWDLVPSQIFEVDAASIYTLECVYGNEMYDVCGERAQHHLRWTLAGNHITVSRYPCDGCPLPCPGKSSALIDDSVDVGDTYELAVSESGEPYFVIATLMDDDWVDGEWVWEPAAALTSARLRIRVYDASYVLVDEQEAYDVIDYEPVSAVDLQPPLILHQNSPNPFNPQTEISFVLPSRSAVHLRVYDVSGQLVRSLIDGTRIDAGHGSVFWNGRDDQGHPVVSGTYFYRLEAGGYTETKRMTLIR